MPYPADDLFPSNDLYPGDGDNTLMTVAPTSFLPKLIVNQYLQGFLRYGVRTVSDGVLNSTTSISSATALFTAADVGATVVGTGIPTSDTIASQTGTAAVLAAAATATASGVALTITQTPALAAALLATQLNAAWGSLVGNVQCWVDTTSGQTTQCVIDANNQAVFSMPLGNYVTVVNSQLQQVTPAQLAASWQQFYTS
jgi:hypothetical protein